MGARQDLESVAHVDKQQRVAWRKARVRARYELRKMKVIIQAKTGTMASSERDGHLLATGGTSTHDPVFLALHRNGCNPLLCDFGRLRGLGRDLTLSLSLLLHVKLVLAILLVFVHVVLSELNSGGGSAEHVEVVRRFNASNGCFVMG
jgi:hypothetical protein